MIKITGVVSAVRVDDLSKRAGVQNLYTYLSLTVERAEPALQWELGTTEQFIAAEQLDVAVGDRVEITTYDDGSPSASRRFRVESLEKL